jgi:hypothetical protein
MNIKRAEVRTGVRQAELPLDHQQLRKLAERNYADRYYNGFSPDERALLSRPQREERYKLGNNPLVCCVTGFSRPDDPRGAGYMFTHLEDYRRPLDWYPVSKRVHYLLHRRFIDPLPWQRLVKRNYKRGAWFTLLTMDVRDMYKPFDEVYPAGLPAADFACQGG